MNNRTPSNQLPLRDFNISSKALAFYYALEPEVQSRSSREHGAAIARREVEARTTVKYRDWPLADLKRLGMTYDPPMEPGSEYAGTWSVRGVQSGATDTCISTDIHVVQRETGVPVYAAPNCTPQSADEHKVLDIALDHWVDLGGYRFEWWRFVAIMGMVEVVVTPALLRQVLGVDRDKSKRMMHAARGRFLFGDTLVCDGLEDLSYDGRRDQRLRAASAASRAWAGARDPKKFAAASMWADVDFIKNVPGIDPEFLEVVRAWTCAGDVEAFLRGERQPVEELAGW